MGITYEVSSDGTLVYTKVTGQFSEEDVLRHEAALASDPRIKPGFGQLADVTNEGSLAPSGVEPGAIKALAARLAEIANSHLDKFRGARYAVVIQGPRRFEMAKLFESVYEGPANVIVFYNLDVAKTWLGCKKETDAGGRFPQ